MKKIYLLASALLLTINLHAQESTSPSSTRPSYFASATELIFSWGNVTADPLKPNNIVRFTCFLHLEEQFHHDFSSKAGIYTGLSIRNVGLINDLNDTVKIKQRVYTLGIPVALKIGNMDRGTYATVGVEGELAFAYKQKVFINDEKTKTVIWFSDRTNLFLPSAFAELKFSDGLYVKFKYYLTDFLTQDNQKINGVTFNYVPTQSQMMYASIGWILKDKYMNKKMKKTSDVKSM
jgi:hypothetical protein